MRRCWNFIVGSLLLSIVCLDIWCILLNRFHYSMDVFLALLVTSLLYTNGALALSVDWWAHAWLPPKKACPSCGGLLSNCNLGEFIIPPCCIPFCCTEGSYTLHHLSYNNDFPAESEVGNAAGSDRQQLIGGTDGSLC